MMMTKMMLMAVLLLRTLRATRHQREKEGEEMDSEPIHSQRAVEGRRRKGSGIEEHVLLRSSENIWV